jgi:hypothetical protein
MGFTTIVSHGEYYLDIFGSSSGDKLNSKDFINQFIMLKIEDCILTSSGGKNRCYYTSYN